jgi:D-alanyl-D-alanine carboxypeptidase
MNPADRDGYLILVNNSNTIDETYLPTDLTDLADTRKDGRNVQKMRLAAAKSLEALYIEMRAAGYKDVSVTSAYRSYSYQSSLFNTYTANEMKKNPSLTLAQAQAITATYSARPGTSEHQTGLCCDMHNLGAADVAFAKKEAYSWLKENAWKFGFILRFPEGKEDITGISFEPWHYRFVGRYHAKAIYDSGLCLEEYLNRTED